MTIFSQSTPAARQKIRLEMLKIVKASVRKKFPLLRPSEVTLSAQRIVAEALQKEEAIEQAENIDAQESTVQ